jgi:hypothetical protein
MNALLTGASPRSLNPQNEASRVKGSLGKGCYLGPRPPASAGVAVASPPNMPSSAPSATITPNRLMAIHPLRATALWPGAGHIVQPQDGPRWRMADVARCTTRWGTVNSPLPLLVAI